MLALLDGPALGFGQVSPAEIRNPKLKALEETHFAQLKAINREIEGMRFPFQFVLSRYVGLDPKDQMGTDTRGVEFVSFHGRTVLKISGNYNAAFDAGLLTQNQRAGRVLDDVAAPILKLLPHYFQPQGDFDDFGFEISYHVRSGDRHYKYEGKENLVLIFSEPDAFSYSVAQSESQRQAILNASEIYLDGKEFGLLLGGRDPMNIEDLDRPRRGKASEASEKASTPSPSKASLPPPLQADVRLSRLLQDQPSGLHLPQAQPAAPAAAASAPGALAAAPSIQAEVEALQNKYQSVLGTLAKEGAAHYHFVDYAPPSLVVFRDQIYLQLTLRNPTRFDRNGTSIYKRAAQSFDLFLAPFLKDLLAKAPADREISGLDITVLDEFSATASSPEAVEYICPLPSLRQFTDYAITNQDLINQSLVLVNGVRIALNLQQVE